MKQRLEARHVVFITCNDDGTMSSYIPENLSDIWLVYMIQTLQDRRTRRLE